MRTQTEPDDCAGDAWERITDALAGREDASAAEDHDADAARLLLGLDERLAAPLRHIPTPKLRSALLTTAVHVVKCGGERIPVTAAGIRNTSRAGVLALVLRVHERSEDDSQMLAIALEHAMH